MEKAGTNYNKRIEIAVAVSILLLSGLLYSSILKLGFFSDDFYVLHRLTVKHQFWAPGFFRPIADLSLLLNYKMAGLNAFAFRFCNLFLHCLNGFLLFKIIINLKYFNNKNDLYFAILAAYLFTIYPYHGETIAWIVCQGGLLATTIGLLILYIFTKKINQKLTIAIACSFYFFGLISYESVIVIPAIIFAAYYYKCQNARIALKISLPLIVVLIIHLILRKIIAGVVVGNYGIDMFNENILGYALRYVKSMGRLFIPGMHSTYIFITALIALLVFASLSMLFIYKYYKPHFRAFTTLLFMLLTSQLVPGIFGVDTHNQDGDRLLYFPSFFLCAVIAFFIVLVAKSPGKIIWAGLILSAIAVPLLFRINTTWIVADRSIKKILTATSAESTKSDTLYIANIPQQHEGAFIFRNGFYEALEMAGTNTSNIVVVNYLSKEELTEHPGIITPVHNEQSIELFPNLILKGNCLRFKAKTDPATERTFYINKKSQLIYWDNEKMITLF